MIFLDLDGTVANFNKKAGEVLGEEFEGCNNDIAWETLAKYCPTLYRDLELLPDAQELINFIWPQHFEILTAIPKKAIFPNVTQHKRDWVRKNIDPKIYVNFGPYSIDKQYHCRNNSNVLIDDNHMCVDQWIGAGGIGILHTDAKSTIRELKKIGY